MTDLHVRSAFLDLVDGHGLPHPDDAGGDCSDCRKAVDLRLSFEHEFEAAMKSMATWPLPAGTLRSISTPIRRAVLAWVGAAVALLLAVGVAVAVPRGFLVGAPPGSSPSELPASTAAEPVNAPQTELEAWRASLPDVLARTSQFQAAILRDGSVTQAEHADAQDAYLLCLRNAGVIAGPSRDALGIINGLTLDSHDPNLRVDDINTECERQWYADVWPGWRAAVISGTGEETRVLLEEFVNEGLKPDFPDDECVSEADAHARIRAGLQRLGLNDWEIRRTSYGEGAPCVGFGAAADMRVVLIAGALSVDARNGGEVGAAIQRFADDLLDRCLNRQEAIDLLTTTLDDLGETNFAVSADPWGPKVIPNNQEDAYNQHVVDGCFVYGSRQLEQGGRTVYYLWGLWP